MQSADLRAGLIAFGLSGALNVVADAFPPAPQAALNLAGVTAGLLGFGAVYALAGRRAGLAGTLAYALCIAGLTGIAGFLFADAVVLRALPPETTAALTAGSAGLAIFAAVIVYVLGVLAFVAALWRAGGVPRLALAVWGLATVPTLAAIALPTVVMTLAEGAAGLAIVWIAVHLARHALPGRASA
jgi:hypothetical protein